MCILATCLLFCALAPACFHSRAFGQSAYLIESKRPASRGAVADCSPSAEQIKAYKDAAVAIRAALEKLRAATAPAKSDTDAINDALKKITFDDSMVGQFEKVAGVLEAGVASKGGRFAPLRQPTVEVTQKNLDLNTAYNTPFAPCEGNSAASAEVKAVIADFKSLQTEVQEQLKVEENLRKAIESIQGKVREFIALIATKAQSAIPLAPVLAPQTLRTELAKALPDLARALRVRRQIVAVAGRISKALDPASVSDISSFIKQKPEFSFDAVDEPLAAALMKLPGWGEQAASAAREQAAAAQEALEKAMRDPFHQANYALATATVAERQRSEFSALADALQSLLTEMQRVDVPANLLPPDFVPTKAKVLSDHSEIIQLMVARFARAVQQLSGNIPVDKSTWSMASIDLFYFDNVERLMRVLSPNVRRLSPDEDFQKTARTERGNLDLASQELEEAEAVVSARRQEVANLQERLRLATSQTRAATQTQRAELAGERRSVLAAERRERAATTRRERLDREKDAAERTLTQRKAEADDNPDKVEVQRRVILAQRDVDEATRVAEQAKVDEDDAKREVTALRTEANKNDTEVDEEVKDLEDELGKAREALKEALKNRGDATNTHRTALRKAFLAAQVENFAFAQARDNAPFLTNLPDPKATAPGAASATQAGAFLDTDPVSRVLLFAFPDSRTIFIRGQRDDIDLVRQIIKEFDQPEGQAMMTLRTMEVNSDGSSGSARRALKFLKDVDDKLNAARSQVEGALTRLRNEINAQVKIAAAAKEESMRAEIKTFDDRITDLRSRQQIANDAQRKSLNNQIELNINRQSMLRLRLNRREETETVAFYDRKVLEALGWRESFLGQTVDTHFLNAVIPSPSRSVNLAQALIALSLASVENRKAIVGKLGARYGEPDPFVSLRRFLGDEGDGSDIMGFQSKLVEALRFNGIAHVLELAEAKVRLRMQLELERTEQRRQQVSIPVPAELNALTNRQEGLEQELASLNDDAKNIEARLSNPGGRSQSQINDLKARLDRIKRQATEVSKAIAQTKDQIDAAQPEDADDPLAAIDRSLFELDRDLQPILRWLQGNTGGIPTDFLRRRIEQAIQTNDGTASLLTQAIGLRRSARFRFTQANESAVNLTFRKYLEQLNRELTEVYVKPAFREINDRLIREKLGVGVMQETSILASNRLSARVDPRGSAQLAVGEERNVLEAARQLVNLFGIAGKGLASGVTGNPAALAGGPAGGILTTAQSTLNALDQMPRDAAPAVYGIATGNLFQVTPVIDPSGQALRFRFDLVSATQIREPNDTIDPLLPRIERHSVNTEVHLADQEIRLISQFQANSRLGIPKRKFGGLPILKDLPGVSEVPLIGWFVKRGGRAAQTQQSFIFCQTTMYPTLSEVLDVAVQSPTFTGLETPTP